MDCTKSSNMYIKNLRCKVWVNYNLDTHSLIIHYNAKIAYLEKAANEMPYGFNPKGNAIALFTVSFSHLHYNVIERGCEAISG